MDSVLKRDVLNHSSLKKQQGAVLAISLFMLLMVTIVGLSTINSTLLEEQMAANSQFKNYAFQESETCIEDTIDDTVYLSTSIDAQVLSLAWPVKDCEPDNDVLAAESEARFIQYSHTSPGSPGSAREGSSGVGYYFYEVRGTAEVTNSATSNTNVRGVYLAGPKQQIN